MRENEEASTYLPEHEAGHGRQESKFDNLYIGAQQFLWSLSHAQQAGRLAGRLGATNDIGPTESAPVSVRPIVCLND